MNHLLFLGSKTFGLELFKSLINTPNCTWEVWHPNDTDDERSNLDEWIKFTQSKKIPFRLINSKREFRAVMLENRFTMVIVCGWYWIIEETDLMKADLGFWGIHNSLLPKFRGGSPLIWSMLSNDAEVGSSFFKLDAGVDSGPIAAQVRIPNSNKKVGEILEVIEIEYKKKLPRLIVKILNGEALLTIQEEENATYCKQRTPEDSLIDFNLNPEFVCRFVNVLQPPYPPAFLNIKEKRISISSIKAIDKVSNLKPGEIIKIDLNRILIAGVQGISYIAETSLREISEINT